MQGFSKLSNRSVVFWLSASTYIEANLGYPRYGTLCPSRCRRRPLGKPDLEQVLPPTSNPISTNLVSIVDSSQVLVTLTVLCPRHALGSRARNLHKTGALTVRFEMPFAIWCSHCPKPTIIGQGVRFNAEKKKVGAYYSTPIFSFRIKHTACGGWIEIRTDPQNTEYVVVDGAKRRDVGQGKTRMGEEGGEIGVAMTVEERERLEHDAFAALEVKIGDRKQAASDKGRIEELFFDKERDWDDTYSANLRLRKAFRKDRKERVIDEARGEALRDRLGLGLEMMPEVAEDGKLAKLVDFGGILGEAERVKRVQTAPLYTDKKAVSTRSTTTTDEALFRKEHKRPKKRPVDDLKAQKDLLRQELSKNTRAALDPFLMERKAPATGSTVLVGVKRKRDLVSSKLEVMNEKEAPTPKLTLVDYDSD